MGSRSVKPKKLTQEEFWDYVGLAAKYTDFDKRLAAIENAIEPDVTQRILNSLAADKPKQEPKVSQWRNPEEKCEHLFQAISKSLERFGNVKFLRGTSAFQIQLHLSGHIKYFDVNFNSKTVELCYRDRGGTVRERSYSNTTAAAADITGLVVFYSYRR